jgi:hypothetical protein
MITNEGTYKKEYCSLNINSHTFIHLVIENSAYCILPSLGFFAVSLFAPFFPHPTYGFGTPPKTIVDYLKQIFLVNVFIIVLFSVVLILKTFIQFYREKKDSQAGYKKVGTFAIKRIIEGNDVRVVILLNKERLKLDSNSMVNSLKKGDFIKIERTATNRLLSYEILHI